MQNPSPLVLILFSLALSGCFTGCRPQAPPVDFQPDTLDPRSAIKTADSIVLAYPVKRKEIRRLSISQVDSNPLGLIETETTLIVLHVFKGPSLPEETRFRHYQENHDYTPLIGPRQGPSGNMGLRAIFFLRRQTTGTLRSVVDVYRPDIPTPWIRGTTDAGSCGKLPDCIASFLLTLRPGYDPGLFLADLHRSVGHSSYLVGYLNTFDYLNQLAENAGPEDVRRGACVELSKDYSLLPSACQALVAGSPAEQDYLHKVVRFREALHQAGMPYVLALLHTKDESEVRRYLRLFQESGDKETSRILERLLNSKKRPG